jgi:outer membrane protein assembly factor BamB
LTELNPLPRHRGLLLVAAAVLLASPWRLSAGHWPRFRGPNGAGHSDANSVPVQWTEGDCNWKVELPGVGHSSPVVWDEKLFLTCSLERTARRTILCLSVADGSVIWRRDYASGRHPMHRDNCYASSTPALDANGVYVTWTTPKEVVLLALDHAGNEKWRRELGEFNSMHGSGTSPIVVGDLVVLANDQRGRAFLIAVDRTTGKTRWQLQRRSGLTPASTPCLYRAKGAAERLIFTTTAHGITAVDPNTGEVDWEVPKVFLDRCVGSPVFAEGVVIGSYGYGSRGTRLVAVRPGSKAAGIEPKIAWDLKKSVPLVPTPIIVGDRVFCWGDDGWITCKNVQTGKQVWRERVDGSFYGSPVRVRDRLYCISKKGEVFVLAVADSFKLLARIPLGEQSFATPAVADDVMYLRTYRHLLSVGGKKR